MARNLQEFNDDNKIHRAGSRMNAYPSPYDLGIIKEYLNGELKCEGIQYTSDVWCPSFSLVGIQIGLIGQT